jgi:ATP-binding cassette, subfamily B, bacterial
MSRTKAGTINSLRNNFFLLGMVWKISRQRVALSFLKSLLGFGCWVFYTVIFMKYLFGAAEMKRGFLEVAVFVAATLVAMLFISLFESWFNNRFVPLTNQELHYHLNRRLFEKATSVDIRCYENPEFYTSYTKASTEVCTRALSVLENIPTLFSALLAAVYVVYTIFTINTTTALIAMLPFVGNFLFGRYANKFQYARNQDDVPFTRRQEYVNRAVYLQKYAKEIRLSNVFSVLEAIYHRAYDGIFRNVDRYSRKIFILELLKELICFPLVFEGVWLYAAYCAIVTKTIQIGDFIVLSSAIVSTTWMLISLSDSIVNSYNNGLFINNLIEFLNYKSVIREDQPGVSPGKNVDTLVFKNVSFTYDGQTEPALRDISMVLAKGEKAALVGHNGAGKSTLIKLIMRLYDPTEGEILLNGRNIKEYDIREYRGLIGTTFQDFQVFSMSVLENVVMSAITDPGQREKAIEALRQCDMYDTILSLPEREDSILTREFDDRGVVFSGGQFQKIAIARAFARQSRIILLDEPSSALDPVAEHQMYQTIMRLCDSRDEHGGKISLIISHRLSSAVMSDRIYLLEHGRIIEQGTHESLMRKKGPYADMFIKQAENYLQEVAADEN